MSEPISFTPAEAESVLPFFQPERILNQDQAGRRIVVLGSISWSKAHRVKLESSGEPNLRFIEIADDDRPALLSLERASFPEQLDRLFSPDAGLAPQDWKHVKNLGSNDIYSWFVARSGGAPPVDPAHTRTEEEEGPSFVPDLKVTLMYPCTETHIRKYSKQAVRMVTETPEIYREKVRPLMARKREAGRLNWVYNILDGRKEQENVVYRSAPAPTNPDEQHADRPEAFVVMADMNWDQKTAEALRLLCIVERRDLWSVRDLKKSHLPWLRQLYHRLLDVVTIRYAPLRRNQLKLYVHYQPTYYHFHIHIVHTALEAAATQVTGKAIGLESIIETLTHMGTTTGPDGQEEDVGMDRLNLNYTLGEASELWEEVYAPMESTSNYS